MAFTLRRLAGSLIGENVVDTVVFGARMRLQPRNNVAERRILFTPQFFDPAERSFLAEAFRPGFVFFDIGANIGGYSLFVAANAPADSVIVAVEPQPDIKERLAYNCAINGFTNIRLVDRAVSDWVGELPFYIDAGNRGESGLRNSTAADRKAVIVKVEPLLDIVRASGVERVDAMKIDVEGLEETILTAYFAIATEGLWPRLLIVENGRDRWQLDLAAHIESKGYRLETTTQTNLIFVREK